uniref:Uncharacterized protein n=1 Tax=Solanum lycopersicum TaxID=4081 RepID=A0A3Q7HNB4_SOLLC
MDADGSCRRLLVAGCFCWSYRLDSYPRGGSLLGTAVLVSSYFRLLELTARSSD